MKKFVILSTLAFILLFTQTAKADLVINGGFQDPNNMWFGWDQPYPQGVGWGNGNFGAAFGYFPGTLSQTISTDPGAWYTFAFLLMHDSPGGTQNIPPYYPETQVFKASWNGSVIFTAPASNFTTGTNYESSPSPLSPYTWERFEFTVQATGESTTIAFYGQDTGNFYFLDNVSVNQTSSVPIPPTVLLLASGLVGIVVGRKKFKKS